VPSFLPHTEPPRQLVAASHGQGAPVVLLHGQPGEGRDWDGVVEALAGRARTVVPDRLGYGRTGGPAANVRANADAVIALLDREHVARAVIVGYSWSGAVALDIAQRFPARTTALVLVASVGGDGSIDELDRALTAPVIGPALALGGLTMLQVPVVRRVLAPLAADRLPRAWLGAWRSFVAEQRALVDELPAITGRLRTTTVPVMVVIGDADVVVRPASQRDLARRLPRAETVIVPGATHLLLWESPAAIADAVVRVATAGEPDST
jgi:pimeloyl-ACP methyl ester carboxylesterase